MRFYRCGFICFLLLLFLLPAGTGHADAGESFRYARKQYDALLASHKKQLYRHNWEKVINRFERFARSYPGHSKAPAALYLAGKASQRLYHVSSKRDDAVKAVAFYKRLADEYPQGNLADDALVLAGGILERKLKQPGEAYLLYSRALSRYPRGDMAGLARQGTARLAAHAPNGKPRPAPAAKTAVRSQKRQLTGIRHWPSPDYTRIVLELNGPVSFKTGSLPGDAAKGALPRIYIDLQGAEVEQKSLPAFLSAKEEYAGFVPENSPAATPGWYSTLTSNVNTRHLRCGIRIAS